jgi:hypothetical protein
LKHLKRSVLSVVFGYLLMAVSAAVASLVASRLLAAPLYLQVNVGYSYVLAAISGYLTAAMSRHRGVLHGSALAVVIVLVGLLAGADPGRNQPRWYPAVVTFGSAGFAVLGAYACSVLRRRRRSAAGR